MKVKIVMLGDGAVGKTSIVRRYLGWGFKQDYIPTVGANFYEEEKVYNYEEKDVPELTMTWVIWDVSGQPAFTDVRDKYYHGAKGGLLVTDLTKEVTVENAENWLKEFYGTIEKQVPVLLLGNKEDLSGKREVPTTEGEKMAEELSERFETEIPWIETSAKTSKNLWHSFKTLAYKITKHIEES